MTIQVISNEPTPVTETPKAEVKEEIKSAPVNETEQNAATESETVETEVEDGKDESDDVDGDELDASDDSEKDKPKKKGGFQRRIDKLNARYATAQQEAEHWKQMALKNAGESKSEPIEQAKSVDVQGKPDPETFDTHAEYVEALTDWKIEQREKSVKETEQKSKLQAEQDNVRNAHYEREKSFADKTSDYKEVITELMESNPKVSVTFEQLLFTSENGPEILYELAKDMKEFERINSLSPIAAAREFGKIESKLSSKPSEKQESKKTTKAPQPINPVGSKGGSVSKSLDDPNLSQKEYEALRLKQMRSA